MGEKKLNRNVWVHIPEYDSTATREPSESLFGTLDNVLVTQLERNLLDSSSDEHVTSGYRLSYFF